MKKFISYLGVICSIIDHVEIFYGNESAINFAKEPREHKCTRNIIIKFH